VPGQLTPVPELIEQTRHPGHQEHGPGTSGQAEEPSGNHDRPAVADGSSAVAGHSRDMTAVTPLQVPPLPGTDLPQAASSNIPSNIASGTGSTGSIKALVRLHAEAAADDLLLDLGVPPKIDWTRLSRQSSQLRRAAD
jgi:hypothetical protein